MKRAILVFLKYPEPGRVKTRLAASLGEEGAATAYRRLVKRVFSQCLAARPDVIAVAYDPPSRKEAIQDWLSPHLEDCLSELLWIPQSAGDLGDRLEDGIRELFSSIQEGKVAVVGTDCVHLDETIWDECWSSLTMDTEVTFGPTEDGGYYLVGFQRLHPGLFREIPWSSETTLEASLEAAAALGLKAHLLPVRLDVDTIEEWKKVVSELPEA